MRLLSAWFRTYWRTMVLCGVMLVSFTFLHLLGLGSIEELSYALALSLTACAVAIISSLLRLYHQLRLLDKALAILPDESATLPIPATPLAEAERRLTDAYLQRSRKALHSAEERQRDADTYFTLWLHQMKTPLAVLDLIAQSEQPMDRALMRQELLKAQQYADMALTYQRLHTMEHDLALEQVPLYPLCCSCARQLLPLFRYGQITLDLQPFDGTVLTDRKWLSTVLTQVLTNALKYTPPGGTITIRIAAPGVLTIRDTGIGVHPQDVPRVFERGFTGCAGRTHEKSTGIGLYLCKEIMRRLNHGIALESTMGVGTLVTLDLRRDAYVDMG